MSDHRFAVLDIGLAFALAIGIALWQLVKVRRSIRQDRAAAAEREERDP